MKGQIQQFTIRRMSLGAIMAIAGFTLAAI
jgi:hypothetical protein